MQSDSSIPLGYCQCGCGRRTSLAPQSDTRRGYVRGQPLRFFNGHSHRQVVDPEAAFWARVDRGSEDECWPWMGSRLPTGYGRFRTNRLRGEYTHRHAWEFTNGPIPDGMIVCHHCDNPPCCNPAHLFLGTDKINSDDKISKGRQARGSRMGSSKLTESDVVAIRKRYSETGETYSQIAPDFGVSPSLIGYVVTRHIWEHVP